MALNKKAYNQYKENSISNSKPEELTLMLYNGIIRFILQADDAILKSNYEKANNALIKAEDIIIEFQYTLDMRYEVSQSMMLLYDYMYRRLVDANVTKDREILAEVLYFAMELRDTWTAAIKLAKEQAKEQENSGPVDAAADAVSPNAGVRRISPMRSTAPADNKSNADIPKETADDFIAPVSQANTIAGTGQAAVMQDDEGDTVQFSQWPNPQEARQPVQQSPVPQSAASEPDRHQSASQSISQPARQSAPQPVPQHAATAATAAAATATAAPQPASLRTAQLAQYSRNSRNVRSSEKPVQERS